MKLGTKGRLQQGVLKTLGVPSSTGKNMPKSVTIKGAARTGKSTGRGNNAAVLRGSMTHGKGGGIQ